MWEVEPERRLLARNRARRSNCAQRSRQHPMAPAETRGLARDTSPISAIGEGAEGT